MYHVNAQGVDEHMINVHYYYKMCILSGVLLWDESETLLMSSKHKKVQKNACLL